MRQCQQPLSSLFQPPVSDTMLATVKNSIQSAMKQFNNEKNMDLDKVSRKIMLIQQRIGSNDELSLAFIEVTMQYMQNMIESQESFMVNASNWMLGEAIKEQNRLNYATFQASLVSCIETKVANIWAQFLNLIDINDNLLLLEMDDYQEIWMTLMKIVMGESKGLENVDEVPNAPASSRMVKNQHGGGIVSYGFPFSSYIVKDVESKLKASQELNNEKEWDMELLDEALTQSPYSEVFEELSEEQIDNFTKDLMMLKYPDLSEDAYKVLQMGIDMGLKKIRNDRDAKKAYGDDEDEDDDYDEITEIFFVVCFYKTQFDNAAKMLSCSPEIAKKVISTMKRQDTEEMVLELQLLKGLLTSFQPTNEQAKKREVSLAGNNTMKEIKYLVEEMFLNYSSMKNIDKSSQQLLEKSRLIWTQLRILQLYEISVRHFSIEEENESSFEQETVFEFWKVLRDMKNGMKETRAWDQIEKFLQNVLNENEQRQPPRSKSLKTSFKKNCAQFFVDIVEEFCFSKHNNDTNTQQNEEVLKKIMRYTFTSRGDQTREFSPIADEADNSPVIRSFILQQLMKREVEVDVYFDQYLRDNMQFAQNDEDKWNMCKLFVNCYEDNQSAELAFQRGNKFITEEYITQLSNFLNTSIQQLTINRNVHEISASLLKDVARARVAITHSCALLTKLYIGDHENKDADKDILRTFFPLLMRFCQEGCKNTEMHLFILKQIVFEHGYRELDHVIEMSEYDWLNMERENTDPANNTGNDRFLVYGIAYKEIRDQMAKEALQRNLNADLEPVAVVDELTTSLALLHESVFANYQPKPEQLNQMMNRYQANALQETIANLQPCQLERDIVEILYHFSLFLNEVSNGVGMLRLFYLLARQPDACQGWYLPTMPSDNFQEIFNTNRRRGRHDGLNQFVPYQCPNGHVYVITECGRAMTNRPCPECGANIGGRDHTLDQQNKRVDGQRNNTLAGYSCGSHQQRPQFAAPERQLKPLNNLLQRLLINLSMLLGCFESNPNSILALIHQAPDHDVVGFFVNHLRLDFRLLREVLGKNNEDIILLIHLFIRHLRTLNLNHLDQQGATVTQLPQPNGRNQFENDFDLIFVQSFVQSYNNDLEGTKRRCLDDLQVGADPLIRRLYEIDEHRETPTSNFDVMKATQLWRYRQPLSINHMRMKLQEKFTQNGGEEFRQLYRFLNEEKYYEKSVKELPKLVEFYKLLHLRYKYRIDKKKAKEITIGDFLKDLSKEKGNKELYKKLQQTSKVVFRVWNQLSEDLKEHGPFKPDANFHPEKLDSKTKFEYFLVSNEGSGRCLQSLIRFLQYIQNDFLILYQQLPGAFIKVVDINVLKESEVIRYTAEEDLLPILYLHCDYSLAIGQGTKIEYNFQEIERRFMEKVCYGKCMIERTLEPFKYRDNVQSSREFINMRKKVPQTEIAYEEQRKMLDELKHIDDLSNTLKAVETAIGFLSAHGGTPNQKYDEYLDTKLRYNPKHYLASKTMKKLLRLTHLCSAWLMLTVERAIRIHNNGQNPFTFDATIFTEPLEGKLLEEAKSSFAKFDKKTMTSHLTEYMVLELPDKDANYDTYELWEALDNYMADKNEMLGDQKKAVLPYSEFIPEEIQLKHVYAYWGLLVGAQSKR
ncbi:E3 ubiquitin-protein ligase rnf213-alpha-like [Clytia hemisphaerica]